MSDGTDQIPASSFSGEATDDEGNVILSTDTEGEGGFGPRLSRFITAGFYNGDFKTPPIAADSELTPENQLPDWPLTRASGTSIHAYSVADPVSASGRVVRIEMEAGAAGDDVYVEQIAQVNGARAQSWVYNPSATFLTGPTVSNALMYTDAQFLKADKATPTGTASTGGSTTTSVGANTLIDIQASPNGGAIPSDAAWLRVRLGYKRNTAATTTTETVTLTECRMSWGGTQLLLVEAADPATYGYATLYQSLGILNVRASQSGPSAPVLALDAANGRVYLYSDDPGSAPALLLDGPTGVAYLQTAQSKDVHFDSADGTAAPGLYMHERTDTPGASANDALIYVRDNGAGKTQVVVKFNTGVVQVIATEP